MKIGNLDLEGKIFLAPMSGITDIPFRVICKKFGASLTYTEMINAEGIVRGNTRTLRYLLFDPAEHPIGVQLYGNSPDIMSQAADIVTRYKPDLLDINFGCSSKKVTKKGAGSALLRNLSKLEEITKGMVKATDIPVTAKIRSGWSVDNIIAVEIAKILEQSGVKALTIHPRTSLDNFENPADWEIIAEVKSAVSIPVIGNGDIFSPLKAKAMMNETGCDAIMIGRRAVGYPWIFRQIHSYLEGAGNYTLPSCRERIETCMEQFDLEIKERGEYFGIKCMKKFFEWYLQGIPGSDVVIQQISSSDCSNSIKDILLKYLEAAENIEDDYKEPSIPFFTSEYTADI